MERLSTVRDGLVDLAREVVREADAIAHELIAGLDAATIARDLEPLLNRACMRWRFRVEVLAKEEGRGERERQVLAATAGDERALASVRWQAAEIFRAAIVAPCAPRPATEA